MNLSLRGLLLFSSALVLITGCGRTGDETSITLNVVIAAGNQSGEPDSGPTPPTTVTIGAVGVYPCNGGFDQPSCDEFLDFTASVKTAKETVEITGTNTGSSSAPIGDDPGGFLVTVGLRGQLIDVSLPSIVPPSVTITPSPLHAEDDATIRWSPAGQGADIVNVGVDVGPGSNVGASAQTKGDPGFVVMPAGSFGEDPGDHLVTVMPAMNVMRTIGIVELSANSWATTVVPVSVE